ncbi:MAG: DUF6671 family protein [Brumimicrobium sp.]|nr:DUF6671 family protein [Brumimicrobium sp.]
MGLEIFKGRKLVIATMHGKEKIIAPILESALGVICHVPQGFDTDRFGTFSGEIPRKKDPVEIAREKCLAAMNLTGSDLAIASEGSFGPHPSYFFAPADDEWIVLTDSINKLQISGRKLSTETNFGATRINSMEEGLDFAAKHGFPAHAMIIRNEEGGISDIVKNITDENRLKTVIDDFLKKYGEAWIETDMRAMHNPTRQSVIKEATENLIELLKNSCPSCDTPGFQVSNIEPGLPCETCNMPTRSTLAMVFHCSKCRFEERKLYPHKKETESAMYCDFCNP